MGTATALAAAVRALPQSHRRFIDAYVRLQNAEEAAKVSRLKPEEAEALMANQVISQAIERRIILIETENARLAVKQDRLTIEQADAALLDVLVLPAKTHGHIKLRAIDLTYRRKGLVRESEFVLPTQATPNTQEDKPSAPTMYRSFQRTTTTHEEVRELHAPIHPPAKTIPAVSKPTLKAVQPTTPAAPLVELID